MSRRVTLRVGTLGRVACLKRQDFTVGSSILHTLGAHWSPPMKSTVKHLTIALGLVVIGVALAAAGIYVGETDDAPGAALMGILLMIGMMALAWRTARRKA